MISNNFFWTINEHLEAEVMKYFAMLEEYNETYFGGQISILLLGSMSRGEASWKTINGVDTIVSDIEFFTIVPQGFNQYDKLNWALDEAKKESFPDQDSSLFHIDPGIGNSNRSFMGIGLERKLITFDASVFGYCIVGPDVKNKVIPNVTLSNINMQDIWEVLIHRIFSAIYWGMPLKESGHIEEYRYNIAKNSLDLMTVLLVNNGKLISGFKNRLDAVKHLDIDESIKQYFEYCLSIKLSTECNYRFSIEEMEIMFLRLLTYTDEGFKCHLHNNIVNFFHIAKRYAGMMKRMFKSKHIPCTQHQHFNHMYDYFSGNKNDGLESILLDNYVLNGYPIYDNI